MADPVVIVEIEFTPGVWTPVSAYLRSGNTKRGRARAVEKVGPGKMTLVLANQARTFDPEYAANISPGNLTVDKKIRVKATYAGITYPVFTGYIDRIIQRYNPPNDAVAVFSCSDALSRLASSQVSSVWDIFMNGQDPHTWYRLDEKAGPYASDQGGANKHGWYQGTPGYGAGALVTHEDNTAVTFGDLGDYLVLPPGSLPSVAPWTVLFFVQIPVAPPVGQHLYPLWQTDHPNGLNIYMDDLGAIHAAVFNGNVRTAYVRSSAAWASFAGPNAKMLTVRAPAGGALEIFIGLNKVSDPATAVGTGTTINATYPILGSATDQDITIDEFLTFNRLVSEAELQEFSIAANAWEADGVWQRINRILNAVYWPEADRHSIADDAGVLRSTTLKTSALAHLEEIVDTIAGRMFIRRDGKLHILSRNEHVRPPYANSQVTFGDEPWQLGYTQLGDYALDVATIENVILRRWTSNWDEQEWSIERVDWASVYKFRRQVGDEITSHFLYADQEGDLAQWRLAHLSQPYPYVEGLHIEPRKSPDTLFPQVLGRELGDRITWSRRPQKVGGAIFKEVIIEGVNHSFAPKKWTTEFFIDATDAAKVFLFDQTPWDGGDWRWAV